MRLYRAPFSTNVERVTLALCHKRVPFESVWIDYRDRSEVERVSGQGLVPVIDDDGTVVADSPRILAYLEERYPEPPLYPSAPARRAEIEIFIDWFNHVWKRWPNGIDAELDSEAPDHALIDEHAAQMAASLDRFEALIDRRPYLFGDRLSAADCIAYPLLKYAAGRTAQDDERFHVILDEHQRLLPRHRRLAEWIARVAAPPS
jgi:glutathione S-transferase